MSAKTSYFLPSAPLQLSLTLSLSLSLQLQALELVEKGHLLLADVAEVVLVLGGQVGAVVDQRLVDRLFLPIDRDAEHRQTGVRFHHGHHTAPWLQLAEDDIGDVLAHHRLHQNEVVGPQAVQAVAAILGEEDDVVAVAAALLREVPVVAVHHLGGPRHQALDVLQADDGLGEVRQADGDEAHAGADVQDARLAGDVRF